MSNVIGFARYKVVTALFRYFVELLLQRRLLQLQLLSSEGGCG